MLRQVLEFTRNPIYEEDENQDFGYRVSIVLKLIAWAIVISFAFLFISNTLESTFNLDFGKHAGEELMENYSIGTLVFLVVLVAPQVEELIFRGPLYWFRSKKPLKIALYISITLFGAIHLFNFEDFRTYWWMTPLLIAPQLSLGMFAGFVRIRFGLLWAMGLHAGYNLLVSTPLILSELQNISLE